MKNAKMSFGQRLRRAFTITELVIVIAVIAILAAVLIPTFSNVIANSKKSADEATLKLLNEALYSDSVLNGRPEFNDTYDNCEETYVKVMTALYNADYTDQNNMYLLACDIKQDNMYMIWFNDTNTVELIEDIQPSQFATNYAPNAYNHHTDSGAFRLGLLLSNHNSGDHGAFAEYYAGNFDSANLAAQNSVWGAAVIQFEKNESLGLTTGGADLSWAKPENTQPGAAVSLKAESSEAAAKNLVGIMTVVASGNTLSKVNISFEAPEEIDLTGGTWTPISDAHRDSMGETPTFQGNINFNNSEVKGLTINNDLVSASADYQDQSDNGFKGGGYNITYGLFGALNGLENPITISNLTMTDCQVKLNGVAASVNGQSVATITDSAGLIAGYAVGNVTFKNIKIGTADNPCYIEGYDSVGALVGRYYRFNKTATGEKTVVYEDNAGGLTIEDCEVYANVYGERRAGGLVGIIGNSGALTADKTSTGKADEGAAITVKNTTFQGLVFCDGTRADADQYGALFGGFISKAKSFTLENVTVSALVVAKDIDSPSSASVWDPNKVIPLYGGSLNETTISQMYSGEIAVNGLIINNVTATQNGKTISIDNLRALGDDYSTVLPSVVVTAGEAAQTYNGTFTVSDAAFVRGELDKEGTNSSYCFTTTGYTPAQ